jgi:sugar transferase (PEP-CTERM/EpsH1 system associated)
MEKTAVICCQFNGACSGQKLGLISDCMMKPPLLYLCHRIPYPPNKGDKIRSFHLLKYLCEHYRVYLGAFIDDPEDWQYESLVADMCAGSCFIKLDPGKARLKSLKGLLSGQALTLPYYQNNQLARWVRDIVDQNHIRKLVVYSSSMAQYVMGGENVFDTRVVDFVDIDSDKWQQYSRQKKWPLSWIYRREGEKLFAFEQAVAQAFDASLFVSSAEAGLFQKMAPQNAEKIAFYNNGVDTVYFSPDIDTHIPYQSSEKVLVFTGAMDYWPNVDAVTWFAKKVFPALKQKHPDVKFYIVGSNPTEDVQRLGNDEGIVVTGRVTDVRPYLKHALAAVAPMRIARGIQNKVLEAMAMAKPVLVTDQALEGIKAEHGKEILLGNTSTEYQLLVQGIVEGDYPDIGEVARQKVIKDFSWEENLPIVGKQLGLVPNTSG